MKNWKPFNFRGIPGYVGVAKSISLPRKYVYFFRHGETDWTEPVTIESRVVFNRWGFFVTNKKIPLITATRDYLVLTRKERKQLRTRLGDL